MNTTEIVSLLSGSLTRANLEVLCQICKSILIATGKITMLEISRTTKKSYRTLQRFYALTNVAWEKFNLLLFKSFVYKQDDIFLLAADETVEKKAGKNTHGISYFFSNLLKQTIPAVAFIALSIISVSNRKSYPLAVKQIEKTPQGKNQKTQVEQALKEKGKRGRPKGSKNKAKAESEDIQYKILNSLLQRFVASLSSLFGCLPVAYLLLDGYFGNQHYVRLARKYKVHLISKLKYTSGLYLPYSGAYSGKGRKIKYGQRINSKAIPAEYLVKTVNEMGVRYQYYQVEAWNKSITDYRLNVVIIKATVVSSGKTSHCYLFTTDLLLAWDKMVDYYSLRFQIEFNFRDAKQYFGLADFKNYKQQQVNNAVNLSFFMCNFAYILIEQFKKMFKLNNVSILDLKAFFRAEKLGNEALQLKMQAKKSIPFLNTDEIFELAKFQAVNF